jgi:hypothetical protein
LKEHQVSDAESERQLTHLNRRLKLASALAAKVQQLADHLSNSLLMDGLGVFAFEGMQSRFDIAFQVPARGLIRLLRSFWGRQGASQHSR